jgi:hypothetical protein
VIGGWAAAELLGASCGPADAAVEVIVPGGSQRRHPGPDLVAERIGRELVQIRAERDSSAPRAAVG